MTAKTTPNPTPNLTPNQELQHAAALTFTREITADRPLRALPHALIFGGQNTPAIAQLVDCWQARCAQHLGPHQLSATQWPASDSARPEQCASVVLLDGSAPRARKPRWSWPRWLQRLGAACITVLIAWLDDTMRVSPDGRPLTWRSKLVARFTRFSVDVLYDRSGIGARALQLALEALRARPQVVVAHSFGGTLALAAAWALWRSGDRRTRFTLITLGTSCGPTVVRSPLLRSVPRTADGQIMLPPNVDAWRHFYSRNDALVAAPALPHAFAGVEQIEVDTGPFTFQGHAHALSAYLAVPEIIGTIKLGLARD